MARTKRGVVSRAKHKKVLKTVKGQYGRRKNTIRKNTEKGPTQPWPNRPRAAKTHPSAAPYPPF